MDSYSMTVMTKALVLSVLIHLIILFFLGKISFPVPEIPGFPEIRITFARAASIPSAEPSEERGESVSAEDTAPQPEKEIPEPLSHDSVTAEPVLSRAEIPEQAEAPTEPAAVFTEEKVEAVVHPELPAIIDDAVITTESAETVESTVAGNDGEARASVEAGDSETGNASSANLPDLSWEGGALSLRSIPEPEFSIPYGAVLPEHISISFSVLSDGTVMSIRILPPGSGHVDLDRQIRAYVADFLFEEFDSSELMRRGTLKLYLKAMGSAGI